MTKKDFWKTPYRKKNRFYIRKDDKPESLLFSTLPSFFRSIFNRKQAVPDAQNWINLQEPKQKSHKPLVTWIGHASFLIQLEGLNILTDPIFGDPSWLFPRQLPPGISIEKLPFIDIVLISHNHRDHMDEASLSLLGKNYFTQFLVPYGDKHWFVKRQFKQVIEHEWWQTTKTSNKKKKSIRCTFLPAAHWSRRGLFDKNRSLWGSWMIESENYTIYFGGDTAYDSHFLAIGNAFSRIDIGLLPIGPCEPRSWMKYTHISSEEAGQAFLDINAHHFIPMHWGTFSFGIDYFNEPVDRLKAWWQNQQEQLHKKQLHTIKIGQQLLFDLPLISQPTDVFHRDKNDKQKEEQ